MPRLALLALLAIATLGCAAQRRPAAVPSYWVDAQGGTVVGASHERALDAARQIWADQQPTPSPLRVHVLASKRLGAWAWPDGNVYLTSGLTRALADDELAAALAHEVGHLVAEGHLESPAALDGEHSRDSEERADRVGVELLAAAGLPRDSMSRMLAAVMRRLPQDDPRRDGMTRRLALLEAR